MIETIENKKRAAEILLVEDNYGDVLLTKKAFAGGKLANRITNAKDGAEALAMLRQEPPHENAPKPDIILLDLNLPGRSGRDVLEEIKSDARLKHIPVVVLTSSRAELDVIKSYNLHANGYIIKPLDSIQFSEVVRKIEQFWFTIVVLPDEEAKKDAS